MKEYQDLIGKIIIGLAIVIAGLLISRALSIGFYSLGEQIFMTQ